MDDELREKLKEIMEQMECHKDFQCSRNGFERLCKARDFGVGNFLYCLEENPMTCNFAISFGFTYICRCPLRVFIEKNMAKRD